MEVEDGVAKMPWQMRERWRRWVDEQRSLHALHMEIEPDLPCPCGICMPSDMALAMDVQADLYFLTQEEGGLYRPVVPGYRSQFYYDGWNWDPGPVSYVFPLLLTHPGDCTRILVDFVSPEVHFGRLFPGKEFQVREGSQTVARGQVTALLSLERHARTAWPTRPRDQQHALTMRLQSERSDQLPLDIDQIQQLLGVPLPPAAWQQESWWRNDDRDHLEPLAWLEAGWLVDSVDLPAGQVQLVRSRRELAR